MAALPRSDPAATTTQRRRPPQPAPSAKSGESLADGAAGIALLHIERARTGTGRWPTVHAWLAAATRTPISASVTAGLFSGAPAVAYALHTAARPDYLPALSKLDTHIAALTRHRMALAHERMNRGEMPALREYDLISGLTGIGCYLLRREPAGDAIRDVLRYLVRLTDPLDIAGETVPGWWTAHGPTDQPMPDFPGGHGNLGMAHGITGPLALLAHAMKVGVVVPGHGEAIGRICSWTDRWRLHDDIGTSWPPWITAGERRAGRCVQRAPTRPSWCYGTPGQARAQQLVGQATGDVDRQRGAEMALLACVTDELQLRLLTDASLCHGWAGLLLTVWRTATDAGTSDLTARMPDLRTRLRRYRPALTPPGLLTGTAGVDLALEATNTNERPTSQWDTCLLTSG